MADEAFVRVAPNEEAALKKKLASDEEQRLDEVLLLLLRKGFEVREAGSFKGWH